MDYRPISSLQTSYKFLRRCWRIDYSVLLQHLGDSQQDFVHGRQKTLILIWWCSPNLLRLLLRQHWMHPTAGHPFARFSKGIRYFRQTFLVRGSSKIWVCWEIHTANYSAVWRNYGHIPMEWGTIPSDVRRFRILSMLPSNLFAIPRGGRAVWHCSREVFHLERSPGPREPYYTYRFSAFVDDSTISLEQEHQLGPVLALVLRLNPCQDLHLSRNL